MHTLNIPPEVIDRIVRRRGRLHILKEIDPNRTAVVVIDMQSAYLSEDQPGFSKNGLEIVPAVNALVEVFREAGGTVIWIRNTLFDDGAQVWPAYAELRTQESYQSMLNALAKGTPSHQISSMMATDERDLFLDKCRYSAFIQGSSDLDSRLRERAIDTLIIGGVLTNVCCESTARDAMMLNYRVTMAAEATAAHTNEEYNGSLTSILFAFGDVMTNAELFERLPPRRPSTE